MRLRWLPEAANDLESIYLYSRQHHPSTAQRTVRNLYDGILALRHSPSSGRPGSVPGTRELVFSRLPFVVTYRILDQAVEILYIRHGAQGPL